MILVDMSAIMRGTSTTVPAAASSSRDAGTSVSVPSSGLAAPQHSKALPVTILPSTKARESTAFTNKPNDHGHTIPRSRPKPTFVRRPVTRSRNRAIDNPTEIAFEPPLARPEASKIPRLVQGTNHIKTYYHTANEVFKGLNMNDGQTEVDFVAAFISGITDSKIGNRLVIELQRLHPCRNRKDGRVEVLCDWDDVTEGLRKAGLLSSAKEPSRTKPKILGELSDLGL
jgi:hypothetical protein